MAFDGDHGYSAELFHWKGNVGSVDASTLRWKPGDNLGRFYVTNELTGQSLEFRIQRSLTTSHNRLWVYDAIYGQKSIRIEAHNT